MLVSVVSEKNTDDVIRRVSGISPDSDSIEVGFDKFHSIDIDAIKLMREKINRPVIFTLRSANQGGVYQGEEAKRLSELMELGSANPDYIDFEYTIDDSFIKDFHAKYPNVKIIRSYHDFECTPFNLKAILSVMIHPDCTYYKIVTMATSSVDNLRMLHFVNETAKSQKIIGHCMGELGIPSRISAPILGSNFQYVSLSESETPAPGILSLQTSVEIYRAKENNAHTKIYAVLGDPIAQSQGHLFHNVYFRKHGINAVYVKFKITKEELAAFFENLKGLPFHGFSVTMPLKKDVLQFVNHFEGSSDKIGAINTLRRDESSFSGLNTDGIGALEAVEKIESVNGKKVLILGAGGSARAIAFEAKKRGAAAITVINRTLRSCDDLISELNCDCYDFNSAENATEAFFDFAFNTLPANAELNESLIATIKTFLSAQTVVMDINYHSSQSHLISAAKQCESQVIDGYDMFVEQALMQQNYWLA
ncbi:MAG: shikimate dehydrogenase [Gammaproteobacteria bacterium]|nr:shikimate dehydrogenase [Gammaproteobacteria bacterium]